MTIGKDITILFVCWEKLLTKHTILYHSTDIAGNFHKQLETCGLMSFVIACKYVSMTLDNSSFYKLYRKFMTTHPVVHVER